MWCEQSAGAFSCDSSSSLTWLSSQGCSYNPTKLPLPARVHPGSAIPSSSASPQGQKLPVWAAQNSTCRGQLVLRGSGVNPRESSSWEETLMVMQSHQHCHHHPKTTSPGATSGQLFNTSRGSYSTTSPGNFFQYLTTVSGKICSNI